MPFGSQQSGFWFHGRIGPAVLVPPVNVSNFPVADRVHLEVAWEGIGLWSRPGQCEFKQPGEATSLFRTVIAAWAVMSGTALSVTLEGWVEANDAALEDSTMGWMINRPGAAAQATRDSEISSRMRSACQLGVTIHSRGPYRLAVRDIQ